MTAADHAQLAANSAASGDNCRRQALSDTAQLDYIAACAHALVAIARVMTSGPEGLVPVATYSQGVEG